MYAIRMTYFGQIPPVVGWALGNKAVATFPTREEAEKAMNRLSRDKRYTWNYTRLEVAEMEGKRGQKV